MDAPIHSASHPRPAGTPARLPAQRLDESGRAHVDQRAVLALALPLMANSAVQIVLNLTDMWFIGRISTRAGAARHLILAPFGFDAGVERLAAEFWFPRVGGACIGAAVWAMLGFFNGIG